MGSEARAHNDTDRDVVISVQDGNYRLVEVARVTPPTDARSPRSVTVTFNTRNTLSNHRPTSIRVEFEEGD